MKVKIKWFGLSGFLILFFILNSCNFTMSRSDSVEIIVKGDSFTISWDDDSIKTANDFNRNLMYKIYYRAHNSNNWIFLTKIEAVNHPECTIDSSMLDWGIYDLGVSSVNTDGNESDIHSSLDSTADPFCGWYIHWVGSK